MDNRTESEKGDKGLYEYACVEELGNRMSYFISESVNMDEQTIEEPTEETVETVEDFLSSKLASGSWAAVGSLFLSVSVVVSPFVVSSLLLRVDIPMLAPELDVDDIDAEVLILDTGVGDGAGVAALEILSIRVWKPLSELVDAPMKGICIYLECERVYVGE